MEFFFETMLLSFQQRIGSRLQYYQLNSCQNKSEIFLEADPGGEGAMPPPRPCKNKS